MHGATASMKAHWDQSQNALAITSASAALRLVDTHSNSAPYIGFYDSSYNEDGVTGRLGYVGFVNNDDLYVKNHDADGHIYIQSANNIDITGTIAGTSSIPRMAYTHASSTKATVASHQLDSNPSILICDTQPTASLNNGDIWFDIS